METTSFDRIQKVLACCLTQTVSHLNNMFLVVNGDLHLVKHENRIHASNDHEFLLNLRDNPYRAYRVIRDMYQLLQKWGKVNLLRNESKEFYFHLLRDGISNKFKGDTAAMLYIELLIVKISDLIDDDDSFTRFTETLIR